MLTTKKPSAHQMSSLHDVLVVHSNGIATQRRAARFVDVALASLGLLTVALPTAIILTAIRMTGDGPVLYRHERVGEGGDLFDVLKFRTMREGADAEVFDDPTIHANYVANDFKLPGDDPRITRVGRILRKTSLDELPQLINVLRGEMSIVGVRPLLEDELALRPEHDQELYRLHRPGITGLWQVNGRSTIGSVDRVALDREYLENWSFWTDLKIIVKTPFAMLHLHHAH